MKLIILITRIICAVSIPMLIVSSTVSIYVSWLPLYKYGFERYHISKVTRISDTQLDQAAVKMAGYLGGKNDSPQLMVDKNGKASPLYNQKELIHLADVRIITDIFRMLLIDSLLVLLITGLVLFYCGDAGQLIKGLRDGGIIALVFTGVLVIWAALDFDSLFYLFHILSFNNDLWLLDPTRDYLIMMFPQAFFNDAAMLIVFTIILESMLLLIAALTMQKILIKQQINA